MLQNVASSLLLNRFSLEIKNSISKHFNSFHSNVLNAPLAHLISLKKLQYVDYCYLFE